MKKLLSVIMLVCIVMSMCTVSAWADSGTATVVGGASYSSLADALNKAPSDSTIELTAGTYTMASVSYKTLTIKAAGNVDRTNVVIDIVGNPAFHGCALSFYGVTLRSQNANYNGMQHLSALTAKNCLIENEFWSYANTATFTECIFNQNGAGSNYNFRTYGSASVTFNACGFTSQGRCVLVYSENGTNTVATFNGCSLEATQMASGKAAIEIDSTFPNTNKNEHSFTVNINNTQAIGFDAGSFCGNSLWNDKVVDGRGQGQRVTVKINDNPVYINGVFTTTPVEPTPGVNPNPNNPAPVTPAAPVVEDIYYIPATDDNSNMALWSILALALLSTAFVTRKRKNEN